MNLKRPCRVLLAIACLLGMGAVSEGSTVPGEYFSLEGKPVARGGTPDGKGLVRELEEPVLCVSRSSLPEVKGTALLFPGGGYKLLDVVNEGARTTQTLNAFGYDVVMLEYHIDAGKKTRDLALEDASAAWRLLRTRPEALGVHGGRLVLMGYSAGGHLAARLLQELPAEEQPADTIMGYPAYLDESGGGSTAPLVQPPKTPKSRLLAVMGSNDRQAWLKGVQAYVDAWRKAGGEATFVEFKGAGHGFGMRADLKGEAAEWPSVVRYFLGNGTKPGVGPFNTVLPWFLPNERGRLATFRKDEAKDQHAVVFFGDSITRKWNLAEAFPEMKVANRGISGDTTRGMLCRLKETVLDLHPKAIVFMGGINDFFQQNKGTPETIAANVHSILEEIRAASPDTPVLVCDILPNKQLPNEAIQAANAAVDKFLSAFPNAHRVHTFQAFLNADGTQNTSLFVDGTHPDGAGYRVWKSALVPALAKYVPEK